LTVKAHQIFSNKSRSVTAGGAGGGYNLVGNPYACPVNYASVIAASSATLNANFLILQENGSYATSPNGGVIAPHQGFMCLASSGGNINFTEACKNTVSLPNVIKAAVPVDFLTIQVSNSINGLGGSAELKFNSISSSDYSATEDLPFIPSVYENADNIWTTSTDNVSLLRNELPSKNNDEITIPLTVSCSVAGLHSLIFNGLSSIESYNCIWIEELGGKSTNLVTSGGTFSFATSEPGEKQFILHFENKSGCLPVAEQIFENELEHNTKVFDNGSDVLVKFNFTEVTPVVVTVYNTLGQIVTEPIKTYVSGEVIGLNIPKSNNIYLVNIQSGGKSISKRIYH